MVPLDKGNRLLLVGRNQLQLWNVPDAKLIDSSPHRIKGYWSGGLLMRVVSFPRTANFPIFMNENRMKAAPDGTKGITIAKPADERYQGALVWDLQTGQSLGVLSRGTRPAREVELSGDGSTVATIHGDLKYTELAFWDSKTLALRSSIPVSDLALFHLSRDGEHVFIASGKANKWLGVTVMSYEPSNGIEIWNTRTGKLEKKLSDGPTKFVSTTFVSPDERFAVTRSDSEKIVVWDVSGDGTPKYRIDQAGFRVNNGLVGISQDSRYLLTRTKNEAIVYQLSTGTLYRRIPIREEYSYMLSPDSRYAILRSESWVGIYDLANEKMASNYNLETANVYREDGPNETHTIEHAIISPDSKYMMIDGKNDVRVYDIATGELLQRLIDPQRAKYDDKGKLKDGGLDTGGRAGWLAAGNAIYVSGADGRSLYVWNKK